MTTQANLGSADRLVRIVLGVVLLNVAAVATGPIFIASLIGGLFGLATGLAAACPIYSLLDVSTGPTAAAANTQRRNRP